MIQNDDIDILVSTQTKDNIGRTKSDYQVNRTIKGSFQPLKYNVKYRPFGITDKTSNMVFCSDFNITADMRIGFKNDQFIINSILPYRKHVEVYIEKVI
jgi:hypothetical protein